MVVSIIFYKIKFIQIKVNPTLFHTRPNTDYLGKLMPASEGSKTLKKGPRRILFYLILK